MANPSGPDAKIAPRRLQLSRLPPRPRPALDGPAVVDRGADGRRPPLVLRGRPLPAEAAGD